jgi:hypothetical protein
MDELRGCGGGLEGDGPDFALAEEDEVVACRGNGGGAAFSDLARSTVQGRDPDGLLNALGKTGWVGIVAIGFEISASDKDDGTAVGGPRDLIDLLAVVSLVIREAPTDIGGRIGNPKVMGPMFIEHPSDGSSFGRSGEIGRKRSAHDLFERKMGRDAE